MRIHRWKSGVIRAHIPVLAGYGYVRARESFRSERAILLLLSDTSCYVRRSVWCGAVRCGAVGLALVRLALEDSGFSGSLIVRVNEVPPELDLNAVMNPRPANQALRSWSGSVNCGSDAPPPAVDRGQIHLDDKVGVTVRPGSARTRACLVSRCTLGPIGHRKR
eukprot:4421282-Pyramimonas_sp.AAC.2